MYPSLSIFLWLSSIVLGVLGFFFFFFLTPFRLHADKKNLHVRIICIRAGVGLLFSWWPV
jgi:hypothetical protein